MTPLRTTFKMPAPSGDTIATISITPRRHARRGVFYPRSSGTTASLLLLLNYSPWWESPCNPCEQSGSEMVCASVSRAGKGSHPRSSRFAGKTTGKEDTLPVSACCRQRRKPGRRERHKDSLTRLSAGNGHHSSPLAGRSARRGRQKAGCPAKSGASQFATFHRRHIRRDLEERNRRLCGGISIPGLLHLVRPRNGAPFRRAQLVAFLVSRHLRLPLPEQFTHDGGHFLRLTRLPGS